MSSIDYSAFAKRQVTLEQLETRTYDVLISAFNDSDRVASLYEAVNADAKYWLIHAEYDYVDADLAKAVGPRIRPDRNLTPSEFWRKVFDQISGEIELSNANLAVDITGMMRPHLLMLPFMLRFYGLNRAVFYYADPQAYVSGDRTEFTRGPVESVRLIPGMEGQHENSPSPSDVLVIGAGYDDLLIKAVADDKPNAEHFVMFGLPSLQPHMYQESVVKVDRASEAIRDYVRSGARLFAPAHDPFTTAQVLSDLVRRLKSDGSLDHLYLSPVGAKTQVLGFSWYYWCEAAGTPASVLFPFATRYSRETSRGISTIHEFDMELDLISVPGR